MAVYRIMAEKVRGPLRLVGTVEDVADATTTLKPFPPH